VTLVTNPAITALAAINPFCYATIPTTKALASYATTSVATILASYVTISITTIATVGWKRGHNKVRIVAQQRVAQSRGYCIYYSNLLKADG
jgi:hypothetical protein